MRRLYFIFKKNILLLKRLFDWYNLSIVFCRFLNLLSNSNHSNLKDVKVFRWLDAIIRERPTLSEGQKNFVNPRTSKKIYKREKNTQNIFFVFSLSASFVLTARLLSPSRLKAFSVFVTVSAANFKKVQLSISLWLNNM